MEWTHGTTAATVVMIIIICLHCSMIFDMMHACLRMTIGNNNFNQETLPDISLMVTQTRYNGL